MYIIYRRGSIFELFDNKMCFIPSVLCNIKHWLFTDSLGADSMHVSRIQRWLKLVQQSIRAITMKWQQQTESLTWQAARSNIIKVHSEENYLSLRHWELACHNQASIAMTPHASRLNIFSSIFLSHQKWFFFLIKTFTWWTKYWPMNEITCCVLSL